MQFLIPQRKPCAWKAESRTRKTGKSKNLPIKMNGSVEVAYMDRDMIEFMDSDSQQSMLLKQVSASKFHFGFSDACRIFRLFEGISRFCAVIRSGRTLITRSIALDP